MQNQFNYQILDEGTVKLETGEYDEVTHNKADMFAKRLAERLGGMVVAEKKAPTVESEEIEFLGEHAHSHEIE